MTNIQNLKAAAQAASLSSECNVCKRKGLPIFLLRYAVLSNEFIHHDFPTLKTLPRCNHLQLEKHFYVTRILRTGYVYVLVQLKNEPSVKIWLAYEVTPAGSLRQFDPYSIPVMPPKELDEYRCIANNDNVPGSFINLDDEKYSEAWIAFSDISWDEQTLFSYEQNHVDLQRFSHVVLATFKHSPESHPQGMAMSLDVKNSFFHQIPEFRWEKSNHKPPIDSFSGFHPKGHQLSAYENYVSKMAWQYDCNIGALVLEDSMGLVSELNYYRQSQVKKKTDYQTKEDIFHKHAVSVMIESYRDKLKAAAEALSQPQAVLEYDENTTLEGMPVLVRRQLSKEEMAQRTFDVQWNRLLKRYDENRRRMDEDAYQDNIQRFDRLIEGACRDYALWLDYVQQDTIWRQEFHDAQANCSESEKLAHQERLLIVACAILEGGPNDASTDEVWVKLLNPKDDLTQQYLYNVLFFHDKERVKTASIAEQINDVIKTGATTALLNYEGMSLLEYLSARLMLSVNAAVSRNYEQLASVYPRIDNALQFYSFNMSGQMFAELDVQMTAQQYQSLLTVGMENDTQSTVQEVKAVTTDGKTHFTHKKDIARYFRIHDPEEAKRPVNVKLRLQGTPAEINQTMSGLGLNSQVASPTGENQIRISALSSSLFPEFALGRGLLNDETYRLLNQNLKTELRVPGALASHSGTNIPKIPLFLSSTALFFTSSSLRDSLDKLKFSIGNRRTEAYFKLVSSTFAVLGNSTEVCGWIVHRWNKALGIGMVKGGGVLVSISAIVDGFSYIGKSVSLSRQGDNLAGVLYIASSGFLIVGGILAIFATLTGAALLGPAGWGFLLIMAGAGLSMAADYVRSSMAEIWFDRCYYGHHKRYEMPWDRADLPTLAKAQDAFTLLTLGIQVETNLSFNWNVFYWQPFNMTLRLPGTAPAIWDHGLGMMTGAGYHYHLEFFDENGKPCGQYQDREGIPAPPMQLVPNDPNQFEWILPEAAIRYDEAQMYKRYEGLGDDSICVQVLSLSLPVNTGRVRSYRLTFKYWQDVNERQNFSLLEIKQSGDVQGDYS